MPRVDAAVYLVGGAVRDALLGLPGGDRDYVVVGSSPEAMLAAGFRQVGRDFPVFLHPESGEEYALARTERKTARGHAGFSVHAAPDVTLEEDLARRDFTINAIAQSLHSGERIDPFGGEADLRARILRHVSPAFAEDPLRILRAARFMARLAPLGFTLADDTLALMRQMVATGELAHLSAERIWQELRRALQSPKPSAFLHTLRQCGALKAVLPEVDALYGVPQRPEYHPEVDTGTHVEMVCDMAAQLAPGDDLIGFAALTHDLGKARTPRGEWPAHRQHEARGIAPLRQLAARLKLPGNHLRLAEHVCREHLNIHRLAELRPRTVLDVFERCDAFRHPARIAQITLVCEADKRGRLGQAAAAYPQRAQWLRLFEAANAIKARDLAAGGSGRDIGLALQRARIQAIAALKAESGG